MSLTMPDMVRIIRRTLSFLHALSLNGFLSTEMKERLSGRYRKKTKQNVRTGGQLEMYRFSCVSILLIVRK